MARIPLVWLGFASFVALGIGCGKEGNQAPSNKPATPAPTGGGTAGGGGSGSGGTPSGGGVGSGATPPSSAPGAGAGGGSGTGGGAAPGSSGTTGGPSGGGEAGGGTSGGTSGGSGGGSGGGTSGGGTSSGGTSSGTGGGTGGGGTSGGTSGGTGGGTSGGAAAIPGLPSGVVVTHESTAVTAGGCSFDVLATNTPGTPDYDGWLQRKASSGCAQALAHLGHTFQSIAVSIASPPAGDAVVTSVTIKASLSGESPSQSLQIQFWKPGDISSSWATRTATTVGTGPFGPILDAVYSGDLAYVGPDLYVQGDKHGTLHVSDGQTDVTETGDGSNPYYQIVYFASGGSTPDVVATSPSDDFVAGEVHALPSTWPVGQETTPVSLDGCAYSGVTTSHTPPPIRVYDGWLHRHAGPGCAGAYARVDYSWDPPTLSLAVDPSRPLVVVAMMSRPSPGGTSTQAHVRTFGEPGSAPLGSTSLTCIKGVGGSTTDGSVISASVSFSGGDLSVQGTKDGRLVATGDTGTVEESGEGTDTHYVATYPGFAADPSEPPASITTSP